MSLRNRLLSAILLALLISFSLGAALTVWQARRSVQAEQVAALESARQSALAAVADIAAGGDLPAEWRRIVRAFDGNRHLRASLIGPGNQMLIESTAAAAPATPPWLLRWIVPALKPVTVTLATAPAPTALRLQSEPLNEAAERWGELRARVASFAAFFLLSAVLCSVTATRSLRPLTLLAQGLVRVGRGEAAPDLPVAGPRETAALAMAFNGMAAALREAKMQNRQLAQQIVTIAQAERADIARDLHDEIGPLLFAITTFAAVIGCQAQDNNLANVSGQVDAIQQAVARLQRGVRDMLGRLREDEVAPADLPAALTELLAFWRSIRPETQFELHMPAVDDTAFDDPDDAVRDCLFRAAQEGISNAIRHGAARHVGISVLSRPDGFDLTVTDDGAGGVEGPGSGLTGMRSRVTSLGGQVDIRHGAGWTVRVRLPRARPGDARMRMVSARV